MEVALCSFLNDDIIFPLCPVFEPRLSLPLPIRILQAVNCDLQWFLQKFANKMHPSYMQGMLHRYLQLSKDLVCNSGYSQSLVTFTPADKISYGVGVTFSVLSIPTDK